MSIINIIIADDSATETKILRTIFEAEQDFRVIACASNGQEAVELNAQLKPSLITMDIQMPVMDGIKAIREIMSQHPTPIVVISSKLDSEMKTAFSALEAGALSVLEKPVNINSPKFEETRKHMIDTLRSMAEIKVITRRRFNVKKIQPIEEDISATTSSSFQRKVIEENGHFEIVAIGTSLGGPQALKMILSKIPKQFPIPIVVVQHMTTGYMSGFVHWLDANISIPIKEAMHDEVLKPGVVYFAPDLHQCTIEKSGNELVAKLTKSPPISGFCPSATVLLASIAKSCGKHAIGILLTGMGEDGAEGLLQIKKAHGLTIIQDPESAVVFGMAGVAQKLGAVDKVIDLNNIAEYLVHITKIAKNNKD